MNTIYTIKVEVTYNMNNGESSSQAELATTSETTLTNVEPTASIDSTSSTTKSITVNYTIIDDSDVSTSRYVAIYDGGALVDQVAVAKGTGSATISGLDPSTTYEVRIIISYNLKDGNGVVADTVMDTTNASTNDILSIENILNDIDSNNKGRHQVDVVVNDVDGILTSSLITATLYENGAPTATYIVTVDTPTTIQMINLLNDYDYQLVFTATYDVGNGQVTEDIQTYEFTTEPLVKPDVQIDLFENWTLTPNVSLSITIGDDNGVNSVASDTGWTAYLYADGVQVDSVDIDVVAAGNPENTTTTITFSGYAATGNEAFTVIVTAMVDMHDVPGGSAVETALDSATGIDAGN
jgi:hypothetical protein